MSDDNETTQANQSGYRMASKYVWRIRINNNDVVGFEDREQLIRTLSGTVFENGMVWQIIQVSVVGELDITDAVLEEISLKYS
jgi:hypothetical protein